MNSLKIEALKFTSFTFFMFLLGGMTINEAVGQVKVWEDELILPTYKNDPPNKLPRFYENKGHQGVQRRIYPYAMDDNLATEKEDESYHIIYLENDFIKISIIPSLGGRIYEGVDKTNNYDFFYRNQVIKPSLIGMVGTWISGSNAWGFPHHHGPNTVKPLDYAIEEHEDNSVTVWCANIDKRHRMRILVGYTIHPNSSVVEMTIRPYNRTPIVNSMLFWSNPSVHVDETYQVIFPPSVQHVTQHSKREMASWPIANKRYNSFDYDGVDISWWKNIGVPSSFFSWDPQEDFFGGYDHGKEAGTLWVGNHHVMPGMKFWAWGNNPAGDRANSSLTDEDGHYIELMAGAYTDNQPDYSWLQPYETKDVKMTWYPIRMLGGIKKANENAALNLEMNSRNTAAVLNINSTSPRDGARVKLTKNGNILFEEQIDIDPSKPYSKEVKLNGNTKPEDLRLSLASAQGEILISYQPKVKVPTPEPESLDAPLKPEEIETNEQLYLTGLRLNQFYNPNLDPMPYYEEALRRDSGDYRVNTQLGILYIKRYMWEKAEEHLQTAADRITSNYTRPKDSEAQYYLGLAQRELGKYDEAYDNFYKATWNAAWHSPAYYQLAEIDSRRGDYQKALEHLNRSLTTNVNNLKAKNLKMAVLRKLNRLEEAAILAEKTNGMDLLNYQSRNELALIKAVQGDTQRTEKLLEEVAGIMRNEVQSYLEFSTDYANSGFYAEAIEVLSRIEDLKSPLLHYYLGYYWSQLGDNEKAKDYYMAASEKPSDYVFPFRAESVDVLEDAIEANAEDAMAWYYLGNMLYEKEPSKAITAWENSLEIDDSFYIPYRNLGWAYREVENDIEKSLTNYQKAFALNNEDPRLMYELDEVAETAKLSPTERYETIFANNHKTSSKRSETLLKEVQVLISVAQYDEAIELLTKNSFPQFEGGGTYRDAYQNAYVLRGKQEMEEESYSLAVQDFQTALDFAVGRWGWARRSQIHYLMGTALEAMGKETLAKEHFESATQEVVDKTEYLLYKGLAYEKLNKSEEAQKQFNQLLSMAENTEEDDFFRQFEGGKSGDALLADVHYLKGLAYLGLDQKNKALQELETSKNLNPSHLWATAYYRELNGGRNN